MRKFWLLIPFVLIINGCENDSTRNSNLISLIPENASIIIKTKSIEGLKSVFKNNSLLNALSEYKDVKALELKINYLNYLKPSDNMLLCFGTSEKDSLQISIITKYQQDLFRLDSVPNRTVETYSYNHLTITNTTLDQQIIYSTVKDSMFFGSNDQSLTENIFKDDKSIDKELETIFRTANLDKSISVLINTKHKKLAPKFFLSDELNQMSSSDYFMLDGDLSQDQLVFNGITKTSDSSKDLINIFKNTVPQENQLSKICPPDVDGFMSFTFGNYRNFHENILKFKTQDTLVSSSLFDTASELGVIYRGSDQAVIVRSLDAKAMSDLLLAQNVLETYREVNIYPFENSKMFANHFAPFITYENASKYANIDDFFVFTDSDTLMKDIISSYQNTATLAESIVFQNIMEHLSDESSLFVYANSSSLNHLLNVNFSEEKALKIEAFQSSAIQFIQDTDFSHVNLIIKKNKDKTVANSVSEDINITLDDDLLTEPQFVNNHTIKEKEILVQDVKNNLYLIANDGKVIWKKQLEGRLLGKVEQMDMYKNGRLQLTFATSNRVYVLDRNGKDVSPFPLKFNDAITQPLSVFDYDNKRDYRLMVTQGKSVLMYDGKGKIVSGFTYKKAENTINSQPRHFRIGRKDYIVFVQGNDLQILDRIGKTRINVKNNIAFSGNDIFLYDNKFTTTTDKGDLIQIEATGKMSSLNINLGEKHGMTATGKTLVTMSDNVLNINSHKLELDFGAYTAPKIFYLKDKIYVSVTDLQAKKIYLFDSVGKPIDNFPVYGNSAIEMDNIDNGNGLEFVTKGDSNSILIYQMN
ncbi:MAG: ribonuclease HII [Aquaticitalea sp.]